MQPIVTQIDPILAEDNITVLLHGYTHGDECFIQSFTLPAPITEEQFELTLNEWRAAALPDRWRLFE